MISAVQRRARLAARHGLAPAYRRDSVPEVADAMVALHATEPATVHLAVAARSGCLVADVEQALPEAVLQMLQMIRRDPESVHEVRARVVGHGSLGRSG